MLDEIPPQVVNGRTILITGRYGKCRKGRRYGV